MERDFVVGSVGHCFICLSPIKSQFKLDLPSGVCPPSPSISSLESLSRYLKMDRRKVFNEMDSIPEHLLTMVEKSRLKVELCEKCAHLNETFAKLHRQLEKAEMEVLSCVDNLHKKFVEANEKGSAERFRNIVDSKQLNSDDALNSGKLEIVEVLRAEAIQNCSAKARRLAPRVKFQNLSMEQLNTEKLKTRKTRSRMTSNQHDYYSKSTLSTLPNMEAVVKSENQHPDSIDEQPDPLGYHASDYDDMQMGSYIEDDDHKTNQEGEGDKAAKGYSIVTTSGSEPKITNDELKTVSSFNPTTGKTKCNLCSKEFVTMRIFGVHYNGIHIKVKYKCNLCGKEFNQYPSYQRHHWSAHVGVRFKCNLCNKLFSQKSNLLMHQKNAASCRKDSTNSDLSKTMDGDVKTIIM